MDISLKHIQADYATLPPPAFIYDLKPLMFEAMKYEYQSDKEKFYLSQLKLDTDVSPEMVTFFLYKLERNYAERLAMDAQHALLSEMDVHLGKTLPKFVICINGKPHHFTSAYINKIGYSLLELVGNRGGKTLLISNVLPSTLYDSIEFFKEKLKQTKTTQPKQLDNQYQPNLFD